MAKEPEPARVFTEQELRDRKIGTYIVPRMYNWDLKERTYRELKIKSFYTKLKSSYISICTDDTGYVIHDLGSRIAQMQIDTYLLRKAKGEDIEKPRLYTTPLAEDPKKKKEELLIPKTDFGDEAFDSISDPVGEIIWIYNHLSIADVKPKDAPTPGAYQYLKWVQESPQHKSDFLKTTYAKVVPTKSLIDKGANSSDSGRPNIELLDRLSAEIADGQEQAPVL